MTINEMNGTMKIKEMNEKGRTVRRILVDIYRDLYEFKEFQDIIANAICEIEKLYKKEE